jgi:anti-sigma B factor antagonist
MIVSRDQGGLRLSLSTAGAESDIHVVRVDGVIDTVTSPELDSVMAALVGQNRLRIIVDLGGAAYISSAGWGIFISRLREVRDGGGDIKLARMNDDVREVYDLLEFEGILPRFDRLDAAQSAFNGGNGGRGGNGHHEVIADPAIAPTEQPYRRTVLPTSQPVGRSPLETAILRLVAEDPFYRLGEFKGRLAELGHQRVGRWTIWQTLRRNKLLRPKSRFRFHRRQGVGAPPGIA